MWLAVWSAIERHGDHANKDTIKKVIQYGIPIYSCEETREIDKRIINIKKGRKTSIGGFKIQPIPLQHSVQCFGFLIEHDDFGRLVFATDCNSIPYKFKNVNHFIVESNYSLDLMIDDMCDNIFSRSASQNHMDVEDTIEFLKNNITSNCQSITLIHLSSQNADAKLFKQIVQDELSFYNVNIAKKGLVVELNKEEF